MLRYIGRKAPAPGSPPGDSQACVVHSFPPSLPPSLIHSPTQQEFARHLFFVDQALGEAQAIGPCGARSTRRRTQSRSICETSMRWDRKMTDCEAAFEGSCYHHPAVYSACAFWGVRHLITALLQGYHFRLGGPSQCVENIKVQAKKEKLADPNSHHCSSEQEPGSVVEKQWLSLCP